jgi:glucosamine--fructose-6-phosphate aminotransferase (isomerizing)
VIVIAPYDKVFEKTVSNMQEVAARGGRLILMTDAKGQSAAGQTAETITLPAVHSAVAPLVYAVPAQLLAYHTAVIMGTDVDQPRNLAKSVTVE